MQLGAPGATYQTVNSALRAQLMAAAECDREGTTQVGGGRVDMDIGDVTWSISWKGKRKGIKGKGDGESKGNPSNRADRGQAHDAHHGEPFQGRCVSAETGFYKRAVSKARRSGSSCILATLADNCGWHSWCNSQWVTACAQ